MHRCVMILIVVAGMTAPASAFADAFDRYTNPILKTVPKAKEAKEIKVLTPSVIANHDGVLPGISGALVIVKTNEDRYCKLLIEAARQKTAAASVPICIIHRFVTYKTGQEQAVHADGQHVFLFAGFHLHLDMGQIVPPELQGDLRCVAHPRVPSQIRVEPVGKARMFIVTSPVPGTEAKKTLAPEPGAAFEPRFFNGTFKLFDDGRRTGTLTLQINPLGEVGGKYFSGKDGREYEVDGKIGTPKHAIQFTIRFPRVEQTFHGWMFTGNGKAIAGYSRMQERDTGFYAVRVENP